MMANPAYRRVFNVCGPESTIPTHLTAEPEREQELVLVTWLQDTPVETNHYRICGDGRSGYGRKNPGSSDAAA